jgi:hypothetical protein
MVEPTDSWSVRGGILRAAPGQPGLLRTERSFDRFTLAFEFRLGCRAAAALVLGIRPGKAPEERVEIPLKEDRFETPGLDSTGGIRGALAPAENPNLGNSAWNWCTVAFDGERLRVNIKGVDTLAVDLADCPELAGRNVAGAIGLRGITGFADFRNVMLNPAQGDEQ